MEEEDPDVLVWPEAENLKVWQIQIFIKSEVWINMKGSVCVCVHVNPRPAGAKHIVLISKYPCLPVRRVCVPLCVFLPSLCSLCVCVCCQTD